MIERPKLPPARFVRALDAFRGLLLRVHRGLFPGNVVLYEHFQHFWLLPSLYVAARLDIARHLEKEPLSAAGIAGKTGSDPGNIERLMRALESQGIFRRDRNGLYRLNALSRPLLEGPGSLRYMIMHHLGPVNWNLMSSLEYAVRTGRDSFSKHYGMATYEYLRQHPDEHLVFDRSMSDLSDLGLSAILSARNFREFSTIADIGGARVFSWPAFCGPALHRRESFLIPRMPWKRHLPCLKDTVLPAGRAWCPAISSIQYPYATAFTS